jgi:hypothetical protein
LPADTVPTPDPADLRLVADELARLGGHQPLHNRPWTIGRVRLIALERLPVAESAQALRQEIADALQEPNPFRRPDRLFDALMARDSLPVSSGRVTLADGTVVGGPCRILLLSQLPSEESP